jgi:hypothetical protein
MVSIKPNAIFVSIASYRDTLCKKTLESIFENADKPENVFIGLVQQNKDDDTECADFDSSEILKKFSNNIRILRLDYTQAKGPTWARYLCSTLWNGEQYFFQADSHILLAKEWDTKYINMVNEIKETTKSKKVILSHYTKTYEEHTTPNPNNEVPRMCQAFFNDRGMISFLGAENISIDKHTYVNIPYIAGGFLFTEYTFLQDVPFDPNLPFLFVGEEILLSARAYTAGYDIYNPSENLVFHFYTREKAPKIWSDKTYKDDDAFNKAKMLLDLNPTEKIPDELLQNIDRYGLGKERTLAQFYEFAGIDLATKTVTKNFCRDIVIPNPQYNYHFYFKCFFLFIGLSIFFLAFLFCILHFNVLGLRR